MEAFRMRLFLAVVVVLMAVSAVQNVAAADAPAPSPTSDATSFVPTSSFVSSSLLRFFFSKGHRQLFVSALCGRIAMRKRRKLGGVVNLVPLSQPNIFHEEKCHHFLLFTHSFHSFALAIKT
ncbi:hypothetical protein QQP08_015343 [Theobroma cacao]|nr:hypothetical protein QQP08_015343 [Theobroma cacao]